MQTNQQTEKNLGKTGAKRQSYESGGARTLFLKIMETYEVSDAEEVATLFEDENNMLVVPPMVHEVLIYWAQNQLRALRKEEGKEERKAKAKADRAKGAMRVRNFVLLDMEMPNGKKLRNCTFREVAAFGGWLDDLSKAGDPDAIVGDVLVESKVRRIYDNKA